MKSILAPKFGHSPHLKFKPVFRWSLKERRLRLFRFLWQHIEAGVPVGMPPGNSYSAKLSFSIEFDLNKILFGADIKETWSEIEIWWRLPFVALRIHGQKSYGGIIV